MTSNFGPVILLLVATDFIGAVLFVKTIWMAIGI